MPFSHQIKKIYSLIFRQRGREGGKEICICFSTFLCSHLLSLVCALSRDGTCNLVILADTLIN